MKRNFNDIYQEIYTNGISELTKLKNNRDMSVIAFVALLIIVFIMFVKSKLSFEVMAILSVVLLVLFYLYIKTSSAYRKAFKELVIKRIVYLYNPELYFDAKKGVSKMEYVESFFDGHFDRFYSEDFIQGQILDKFDFKMSQVRTEVEQVETDSNGNTHIETHTLFSGLFGIVEIQDSMIMKMDITSNNFLNKYHKDRIEVDSSEFEEKYDMFSTDKVQAMEIFTSDIIEEFNKFEEDAGYVMQIKVVPNRLYFRIACGDAFEAPALKGALSYDYLYKNFRMIDFPIHIITRIIENALDTRR